MKQPPLLIKPEEINGRTAQFQFIANKKPQGFVKALLLTDGKWISVKPYNKERFVQQLHKAYGGKFTVQQLLEFVSNPRHCLFRAYFKAYEAKGRLSVFLKKRITVKDTLGAIGHGGRS